MISCACRPCSRVHKCALPLPLDTHAQIPTRQHVSASQHPAPLLLSCACAACCCCCCPCPVASSVSCAVVYAQIASDGLKGRVIEVSLADLQKVRGQQASKGGD
jgi:hypothetical protein